MGATDGVNSAADRAYYEHAWRLLLRELLGWGGERAAAWARERITSIGDNPFLTHDDEAWMVTPLLVPADVRDILGSRLNAFHGRVSVSVCSQDPGKTRDLLSAQYDWHAARSRLQRLIELARSGVDPDQMM